MAMIIPLAFTGLAYMSVQSGAKQVFGYLTNMVAVFGSSYGFLIASGQSFTN
jgi:amino acid permease